MQIFTVGHSNHDLARFIELLREAGATAVADVRSQPYSQRYPQYNRSELERELRDQDLAYAFLGDSLGGRPGPPSLYDPDGRVNYERVRAAAFFHKGLDRLVRALDEYAVALLCSEEDPLDCHRGLMIAPALVERGLAPDHIRGDGQVETTPQFEARLLAETKVGAGLLDGLFAAALSPEERGQLLAEAYRKQAQRRAFRMRSVEDEGAAE